MLCKGSWRLVPLLLTAVLLIPATAAEAAPPTDLSVRQNGRSVTAAWLLPPGWYTDFLEFSPTPDVGVDGFFMTPAAIFVPIGGPATSWSSAPDRFSPGRYYVHVSAYDPACDAAVQSCPDEFSTPPGVLDVSVDPNPPGPPLPPPHQSSPFAPPAADRVISFSTLRCASTQKTGSLVVEASMPENGTITVGGSINVPNPARVLKLKAVSLNAVAGKTIEIRLKLPWTVRRAVKKALRRHQRVKANLTIMVRDGAGNTKSERRAVRLKL